MTWQEAYARWREEFAKALDPEFYSIGWLDGRVANGSAQFFSTDRAAILTELRTYPTGWIELHGLVAAGDRSEIKNRLIPEAENFGQMSGAKSAVIQSRPGWAREMKAHGYSTFQVAIRKMF